MRGANTRRPGSTPRAPASFLKFCSAITLSPSSHNTLPLIAFSIRIHTSNTSGVIFQLLLNEQKTKPCTGKPTSARSGVRSASCRRRSSRFGSLSFLQNVWVRWNSSFVLLQEFEHVLHVGGRLAVVAEQTLAAAALIASCEIFVNAERERLALVAGEKDEGIAAHECRYVLCLPATLLGYIKILVRANAQNSGRHHHVASAPENDGVFQRRGGELCRHERDRVDLSAECVSGTH